MPTERKEIDIPCGCVVICDVADDGIMSSVEVKIMCGFHLHRWIDKTVRNSMEEV